MPNNHNGLTMAVIIDVLISMANDKEQVMDDLGVESTTFENWVRGKARRPSNRTLPMGKLIGILNNYLEIYFDSNERNAVDMIFSELRLHHVPTSFYEEIFESNSNRYKAVVNTLVHDLYDRRQLHGGFDERENTQNLGAPESNNVAQIAGADLRDRFIQKTFFPFFEQPVANDEINDDISSIISQMRRSFDVENSMSIYLRKHEVSIKLTLTETCLLVNSSYTLSFVNPYGLDYTFKRKPMLRSGLQYYSYQFTDVWYQGKQRRDLIHSYSKSDNDSPNTNYSVKTGLEVPLDQVQAESVLRYSAEYSDDLARFFNTFYFHHYCKMLSIDVVLDGLNADDYELQWEIFLSSTKKNNRATRSIHIQEPRHISLSVGDWLFPGDGFVITLNRAY